jgi:hemolysin activation/secretion protein
MCSIHKTKKLLVLSFFLACTSPWVHAAGPLFPIYEYEVKGNSLLTALKVEKTLSPFAGEKKTIEDVELARAALEKAYHEAGYLSVLVTIPEQNVDSAVVALQVVEANVDKVTIRGAEFTAPSVIRSKLAELTGDKAPNFNVMQQQLAELNRSNDLKVTPILKQGAAPGTIDVQLDVEDQSSLHGNVEVNNRQVAGTQPTRVIAGLRYDNLFQAGHSIGLTIQRAPVQIPENARDFAVYAFNYVIPLQQGGRSLALYAVNSRSKILAGSTVTDGDTVGFRLSGPLKGTESYSHNTSVGLDYKNQRAFVVAANNNQGSPQYVPLVAAYNGTFLGQGQTTVFDATLTNGLRGMFTNKELNFNERGRGASANFTTLKLGVVRTDVLMKWALVSKADVRDSSGILLSPEKMTLGGADSVRGYYEAERVGERGYRGSLELFTPSATFGQGLAEWRLKGLGFFDGGAIYEKSQTAPLVKYQLSSSGLGLRLSGARGFNLEADVARTLKASVNTPAHETRYSVRAVWGF